MMADFTCPGCKHELHADDVLPNLSRFWPAIDSVIFTCPFCSKESDARAEYDRLWLGYWYAAGAPHFCGMLELAVPGLRARKDGGHLVVSLGEQTWTILERVMGE